MEPNEVTAHIVDAAYRIHKSLGPGLLETVYEVALAQELRKRGLSEFPRSPVENKSEVSRRDAGGAEEIKQVGDSDDSRGDFSNIFG